MEHRDLEAEQLLGDIIHGGGDVLSYLNDTDGLEGEGKAGSSDRTMEVEGHDHDGSGDRMQVEEGDRDDGSGERTEEGAVARSGEVYILIKPVLTSYLMHSLFWYLHILTLVFLLISSPPDQAQLR